MGVRAPLECLTKMASLFLSRDVLQRLLQNFIVDFRKHEAIHVHSPTLIPRIQWGNRMC